LSKKTAEALNYGGIFFTNANIYALDILPAYRVLDELLNDNRIFLYVSTDAYDNDFFETHFLNQNKRFDFLLDDGPHTLESMKQFIKLYSQIMEDDGILIYLKKKFLNT
jgi:hypothetical protein